MASKRTRGLTPAVLRNKFHSGMTARSYRDKEVVFAQGDTANAVFYIESGTVKLTVLSARHKKAVPAER